MDYATVLQKCFAYTSPSIKYHKLGFTRFHKTAKCLTLCIAADIFPITFCFNFMLQIHINRQTRKFLLNLAVYNTITPQHFWETKK